MKNFENKVKNILLEKNISINEFAQMCGRSKQTIFNWFHKSDFSISELEKISKILTVPISFWYSENNTMKDEHQNQLTIGLCNRTDCAELRKKYQELTDKYISILESEVKKKDVG